MDAPLSHFYTDPIAELLGRLYLPGWSAAELVLDPPWGIEVPAGRVSMFVVLQGGGWFQDETSPDPPTRLIAGDHLISTRGRPHRVSRTPTSVTEPIDQVLSQSQWDSLPTMESTVMLVAQFQVACLKQNPLFVGLPNLVHLNHRRDRGLGSCLPLLDLLQLNRRDAHQRWQLRVRRLAELVFVETLAEEFNRGWNPETIGQGYELMRAITDVAVGPVLKELVDRPEEPWTVPLMARKARISRSAFSERFRNLVGLPPLQFLTEIRMQKACRLLRESDIEISNIASLVGYESPASFSNAFKRWYGSSPAEYRRRSGDAPSAAG